LLLVRTLTNMGEKLKFTTSGWVEMQKVISETAVEAEQTTHGKVGEPPGLQIERRSKRAGHVFLTNFWGKKKLVMKSQRGSLIASGS